MSPTTNTSVHAPANYMSSSIDAMDRHDFAVQKNRKPASTGGGRAWNEDEEVYLLQTRLQKMPYKHIAAHLKKTELACRLHYHQLSHGSNRRKRTTSVSSGSSAHSPIIQHNAPSPIPECDAMARPTTPASYTYSPQTAHVHLLAAGALLPRSVSSSPQRNLTHPVAILPKPSPPRQHAPGQTQTPPLRLDCALPITSSPKEYPIDQARLAALYSQHRAAFWSTIASEYGPSASASQLEESFLARTRNNTYGAAAPPTPCVSPDGNTSSTTYVREERMSVLALTEQGRATTEAGKTSISALLGIDASPRSPQERELIKQIEERRGSLADVRMDMA